MDPPCMKAMVTLDQPRAVGPVCTAYKMASVIRLPEIIDQLLNGQTKQHRVLTMHLDGHLCMEATR